MFAEEKGTDEELFQASLQGDYEDEAAWEAVAALRLRGTEEVFQLASDFCKSEVPLKRARGLAVLGQLGAGKPLSERPHFDECIAICIEHLHDSVPDVVHSAAWALAHLGGDRAVSALIQMRKNADPGVRWAVANGLNGSGRADAIATIIELMDDSDDNVRDWATFALGTQCSVDSTEIRRALRKRLCDNYQDARAEAIWGLARRRDQQGLRMLIEELGAPEHGCGHEMAAADTLDVPDYTPTGELRVGLQKLLDA